MLRTEHLSTTIAEPDRVQDLRPHTSRHKGEEAHPAWSADLPTPASKIWAAFRPSKGRLCPCRGVLAACHSLFPPPGPPGAAGGAGLPPPGCGARRGRAGKATFAAASSGCGGISVGALPTESHFRPHLYVLAPIWAPLKVVGGSRPLKNHPPWMDGQAHQS